MNYLVGPLVLDSKTNQRVRITFSDGKQIEAVYDDTFGYNHSFYTDSGKEIAHRIYERHKVLTRVLTLIGVDAHTAQEDACKVEHDISPETYEAILRQLARVPEQGE